MAKPLAGEVMKVYLDVVWLMNLFIDTMLILLTSVALKRPVRKWRVFLGGFFASLIVILLFTPLGVIAYNPIGKLVYSAIIVLIVFGYHRPALFLQAFGMFYFVTFMVGGGLFALHYFLQSQSFYVKGIQLSTFEYGDPLSWVFILVGFPVLWWFSKKRLEHVVIRKWRAEERIEVRVKIGKTIIEAVGIVDTGNQLRHPISQSPVMFVSQSVCAKYLPQLNLQDDPMKVLTDTKLPADWVNRLTVIPYRGVSGEHRTVLALKPDYVDLRSSKGHLKCKKVIVALTDHQLSLENDFNCILHPDMVQLGTAA
ncbi:sigma-E processing peptidase SpoIIGA [Pullulanibacillus sp. KACC 23026]|uniref:sigma-E processing peptidase SpoIIGA n=1 Tax=Pullulanibacillus sp. KACC 23026 TaxID=3028315 RepID=UPI0023AFBA6F|nr:sigma-E processing peptidase SpoIIGA [Pullulanibacillus sp. KACC 23026]WEG11656.1 sigma-E processing peptidase SpoIIGA [Pullulanibacillus sp. KACC 23026]